MSQQNQGPQPSKVPSKQQQHLDTLQSMINAILIETGKALRSANKRGAKTIAHDNDRLQMFMPSAIGNFHVALDELESDIVRARAVVARDLRVLRAKEQELQNPIPQPVENAVGITSQDQADITLANTATRDEAALEQPADIVKIEEGHDTMVQGNDHPVKQEPLDRTTQGGDQQMKHEVPETVDLVQGQSNAEAQRNSEKLQDEVKQSIEQATENTVSHPAEAVDAARQEADKLQEAANGDLEASNALDTNDDMNYESLFGPESAHDDHPDLNFDEFDFGADNSAGDQAQGQGQDFTQNDGHLDLSTFGDHTDQQFGNDDGSNMLQGLESYANQVPEDGGDINMLDVTNTGGNGATEGDAIRLDGDNDDVGMSGADLDLALGLGGNETAFDELLDGLDFGDGADDHTGLDNQEFDDAFYGIDDS